MFGLDIVLIGLEIVWIGLVLAERFTSFRINNVLVAQSSISLVNNALLAYSRLSA